MGRKKRQRYDVATKGRVALAAWKGDRTVAELASQFAVHPNLVTRWKRQLAEQVDRVFDESGDGVADQEELVAELYGQIGRLQMELEWLKKKVARFD
jgi:transposase-like protein